MVVTCNSVCSLQMFASTLAHFFHFVYPAVKETNQTHLNPCRFAANLKTKCVVFPWLLFKWTFLKCSFLPPSPLKLWSIYVRAVHRHCRPRCLATGGVKRCSIPFLLRRPWRLSLTPSCHSLHCQESSDFEWHRTPFFIEAQTKVMPLYC